MLKSIQYLLCAITPGKMIKKYICQPDGTGHVGVELFEIYLHAIWHTLDG